MRVGFGEVGQEQHLGLKSPDALAQEGICTLAREIWVVFRSDFW
jgi:hypothetical protein